MLNNNAKAPIYLGQTDRNPLNSLNIIFHFKETDFTIPLEKLENLLKVEQKNRV